MSDTSRSTRSRRTLTLSGARAVLDAALAHAERIGVPVNVCVSDDAGHQIMAARMDGAALLSATIAADKAYTVAAFLGIPTHQWFDLIKDEPSLREGIVHRNRLVIFGGGVAVIVDGELVGAIGVSGGSAEQDREIAEAGAAALSWS
ncbi:MAG TPA: heme-binding protein [Marmoricola sp.]|nr:heme-binding protein [Marmoricola sp.]